MKCVQLQPHLKNIRNTMIAVRDEVEKTVTKWTNLQKKKKNMRRRKENYESTTSFSATKKHLFKFSID